MGIDQEEEVYTCIVEKQNQKTEEERLEGSREIKKEIKEELPESTENAEVPISGIHEMPNYVQSKIQLCMFLKLYNLWGSLVFENSSASHRF